jgi:hypothetical protein
MRNYYAFAVTHIVMAPSYKRRPTNVTYPIRANENYVQKQINTLYFVNLLVDLYARRTSSLIISGILRCHIITCLLFDIVFIAKCNSLKTNVYLNHTCINIYFKP